MTTTRPARPYIGPCSESSPISRRRRSVESSSRLLAGAAVGRDLRREKRGGQIKIKIRVFHYALELEATKGTRARKGTKSKKNSIGAPIIWRWPSEGRHHPPSMQRWVFDAPRPAPRRCTILHARYINASRRAFPTRRTPKFPPRSRLKAPRTSHVAHAPKRQVAPPRRALPIAPACTGPPHASVFSRLLSVHLAPHRFLPRTKRLPYILPSIASSVGFVRSACPFLRATGGWSTGARLTRGGSGSGRRSSNAAPSAVCRSIPSASAALRASLS
ncbi:hypothetical protein B0H15DRAFT_950453 [Mycena belliarum]|uniref:Uncharacterized protein n=1 Tax=Mycena belliarum TaxID=1033014 RepID=A0AAD6XL83_9AGAR|nr:hypothetical protein B0H15DRAFT_950453 [Mycena belliae]